MKSILSITVAVLAFLSANAFAQVKATSSDKVIPSSAASFTKINKVLENPTVTISQHGTVRAPVDVTATFEFPGATNNSVLTITTQSGKMTVIEDYYRVLDDGGQEHTYRKYVLNTTGTNKDITVTENGSTWVHQPTSETYEHYINNLINAFSGAYQNTKSLSTKWSLLRDGKYVVNNFWNLSYAFIGVRYTQPGIAGQKERRLQAETYYDSNTKSSHYVVVNLDPVDGACKDYFNYNATTGEIYFFNDSDWGQYLPGSAKYKQLFRDMTKYVTTAAKCVTDPFEKVELKKFASFLLNEGVERGVYGHGLR